MWVILPAVSMAIVHIAGDNLAVVPDMAAIIGPGIYLTTIVAYLIFGVLISGISAWIGVKTGQELIIVVRKLFGCPGKKLMAVAILSVCVPASALTGGYFSGWIIHDITQLPHHLSALVCILSFSFMASGWGIEWLRISNYLALLLIPLLALLIAHYPLASFADLPAVGLGSIDWALVLALVGYNAGGMRPALVVEASAYLVRKKNQAILLAVLAKLVEGFITLLLAHTVLMASSAGPMALNAAAKSQFGLFGQSLFHFLVLCTFINTMVPAMAVNARQIIVLTGLSYKAALALAFLMVSFTSMFHMQDILSWMSISGLIMAVFILIVAFHIHKITVKHS